MGAKAVTACKASGGAHGSLVVANLNFKDAETMSTDGYILDFRSTSMVIDCPCLPSMVDPQESRSLSVQLGFCGKNLYVRADINDDESYDIEDSDEDESCCDIDINVISATPGFILDCRRGCVTVDGAWYVQKFGICNPPYQSTETGFRCPDMLCVLGVKDLRNTLPMSLNFSNSSVWTTNDKLLLP